MTLLSVKCNTLHVSLWQIERCPQTSRQPSASSVTDLASAYQGFLATGTPEASRHYWEGTQSTDLSASSPFSGPQDSSLQVSSPSSGDETQASVDQLYNHHWSMPQIGIGLENPPYQGSRPAQVVPAVSATKDALTSTMKHEECCGIDYIACGCNYWCFLSAKALGYPCDSILFNYITFRRMPEHLIGSPAYKLRDTLSSYKVSSSVNHTGTLKLCACGDRRLRQAFQL